MWWTSLWWEMASLFVPLFTLTLQSICLSKLLMEAMSSLKGRYKILIDAYWLQIFAKVILLTTLVSHRFKRCQLLLWRPWNLLSWVYSRNVELASFSVMFRITTRRIPKHTMGWTWPKLQQRNWLRKLDVLIPSSYRLCLHWRLIKVYMWLTI